VVDVPGSNCTKKLISERVAGLSPEPGPGRPLNCRPVSTKNRSWNFSDLEIFSNFFLSLFLSFSAAFIHPSPGYSVTTPSSGLGKFFHFFGL
jgi:hypothetical protein